MSNLAPPLTVPKMPPLPCADCEGMMHLASSRWGLYYRCENFAHCRGALPALADGTPRGRPRSKALRAARKTIHDELRRLAAGAGAPGEGHARAWLAAALGIAPERCHASRFDAATAERAATLLRGLTVEQLRAWAAR